MIKVLHTRRGVFTSRWFDVVIVKMSMSIYLRGRGRGRDPSDKARS